VAVPSQDKPDGEQFLKLVYAHHDHDYVERRGGPLLYTHMRGAGGRGRYRRAAVERAHAMYTTALAEGGASMRVGGLGLLVLQRAMLAAEDLGGLLHALLGTPPSFERLTSVSYEELDEVFLDVRNRPERVLEPFILPTREVLEGEDMTALEVEAAMRLVALTRSRWLQMVRRVAELWLDERVVAKATMHGIPLVAGELVFGPPQAGVLAEDLRDPGTRPFAVAVLSRVQHDRREVITERHIVQLDDRSVSRYLRAGKTAVRLAEELSQTQATSIELGYGYGLPKHSFSLLSSQERVLLDEAMARQQEVLE
jgi:hypothetical protein